MTADRILYPPVRNPPSPRQDRDAFAQRGAVIPTSCPPELIEAALERVLAATTFRRSQRHSSQRFEEADVARTAIFDFQYRIADARLAAITALPGPTKRDVRVAPEALLSTQSTEARHRFDRARYLTRQGSIDGHRQAIVLARTSDYPTVSIPYHPLSDRDRADPGYLAFLARHGRELRLH